MKLLKFFKWKRRRASSVTISIDIPYSSNEYKLPAISKNNVALVKRANCSRCGAAKALPSLTAYIYCDCCGALIDYDFRIATFSKDIELINATFRRYAGIVQNQLTQAKTQNNQDLSRVLYRHIFSEWIKECPMAVSPRAKNDPDFRLRLLNYLTECQVTRDFDHAQQSYSKQMDELKSALQHIPVEGERWQAGGPFWEYAELFKTQTDAAQVLFHELKIDQIDPDLAPSEVALRIEYSSFCQTWLPHLSEEAGERLLKFFDLPGEYDEAQSLQTERRQCSACGSILNIVLGAQVAVCEACGITIDAASQPLSCRTCEARLSPPVGTQPIICPFCKTENSRASFITNT